MKRKAIGLCMAMLFAGIANAEDVKPVPWYEKIQLKGDVRVREEYIDKENSSARNRMRIRARLSAEARVNDTIKAVIGLASGGDNPASANQTLTDEFDRKALGLDLAYVEWTPEMATGLALDGGKMKNPFMTAGDLIWSTDLNPEGLALKYVNSGLSMLDLMANGGCLWVMERSSDDDTMLYAGQLGARLHNEKGDLYFTAGSSYYYYDKMQGYALLDWENNQKNYGNSYTSVTANNTTTKQYAYEYHEVEFLAELGFPCLLTRLPWKIYGDYVKNQDPDDDNIGYLAGIKFSETKDPGSFAIDYNYRKLEKDATVGAFTDTSSFGGGTDGKGHKIKGSYQIAKNWVLDLSYFIDKISIASSESELSYKAFQADVTAKF